MNTGITVLDAMTRMPITIEHTATCQQAAQVMHTQDVGSLIVLQDEALVGIVTQSDFTKHIVAMGKDPSKIKVSTVMTKNPVSIAPYLDIHEALRIMNNFDIKHAPVVHNDELVGYLTYKDILCISPDMFDLLLEKWHVREQESKPVYYGGSGKVEPYYD